MTDFTLRHLEHFVAVAEAGSMTNAALAMPLAQSSLSQAISTLETAFGVQLFLRRPARGLTLTPAGGALLDEARSLLAHAEALQRRARDFGQAMAGHLTVGCLATIAASTLPRVIDELRRVHPLVRVDHLEAAHLDDLQEALLAGRCEVAILYDHGSPQATSPEIVRERLVDVHPHALLPADHRLADRPSVSLRELAAEPFVLFDVPHAREYYEQLFASAGAEPNVAFRTGTVPVVHSLVARGLGWSLLNTRLASGVSPEGRAFMQLPLDEPLPPLTVTLAYPARTRLTQRASAFVEQCRSTFPVSLGESQC